MIPKAIENAVAGLMRSAGL